MGKILKQSQGVALVMVIIVTTCVILIGTTLLNLSYRNYLLIKAHGSRNASYYVADYGAEKVIKNIETVVESAKIYANEMVRDQPIVSGNPQGIVLYDPVSDLPIPDEITPYEYLMKYVTTGNSDDKAVQNYFTAFETYYKYFIEEDPEGRGISSVTTSATPTGWVPVDIDNKQLTEAQYSASLEGLISTSDYIYTLNIASKGKQNGQDKYERQIKMKVGVNPWGYSQTGTPITSNQLQIKVEKNTIYPSPQWSNALASSGDIVIKDGDVIVEGDIYVNGKTPTPQAGKSIEGSKYGGLVVGKDDKAGKLTVEGNIFSTGYVHTNFPGSEIYVARRNMSATDLESYKTNIRKIYRNSDPLYEKYTEESANLNYDSTGTIQNGNPLSTDISDETLSNLGLKQVHDEYINYLKYTYEIQNKSGGFIYANSVQVEKDPQGSSSSTAQKISTDGSLIIYDNLEIDSNGEIQVGENFYGYKSGSGTDANLYDRSSSIITNHIQGIVSIGKRLYAAGVAYVTAFYVDSVTGISEPYQTGEAVSLYKNFYAYRVQLPTEDTFATRLYNPFRFLVIPETAKKFFHVKEYNRIYDNGLTIGNGGSRYDKDLIKLNGITEATEITADTADDKAIYDNTASNDMGYSEGMLMGKNANNNYFIGNIKNEDPEPATKSLLRQAFINYIVEKYATLMEMKALKSINGEVVTVSDLTSDIETNADGDEISRSSKLTRNIKSDYNSSTPNYIAVDGNLLVSSDNNKIIITSDVTDVNGDVVKIETDGLEFKGLIFATGKIEIDCGANPITIEGAVVSAKYVPENIDENVTGTEGIVFSGSGTKTINYNKDVILEIFKNSEDIKTLLTSKRGSVEIMKKVYNSNSVPGFNVAVGSIDLIESIADKYEIADEISMDSISIINGGTTVSASSKNYRIISWKVEK